MPIKKRKYCKEKMKLIDLLSILTDYTNVKVYEVGSSKEIAKYDGKDAIPTELNKREIHSATVEDGWFKISIR